MDFESYVKLAGWWAAGIWALFAATQSVLPEATSKSLGRRITAIETGTWVAQWTASFSDMFDAVFGSRILSVRFLLSSILASLFAIGFVFGAFFLSTNLSLSDYASTWGSTSSLAIGLSILALGNLIPDFLSLVETRAVVRIASKKPTTLILVALLVVDVVFTILIIYVFLPGFVFLHLYLQGRRELFDFTIEYSNFADHFIEYITGFTLNPSSSVYFERAAQFYSTFLTSIWLWIYGAGLLLTVVARFCGPIWKFVRDTLLDFENKPILALGWLAAAATLCTFMLGWFFNTKNVVA